MFILKKSIQSELNQAQEKGFDKGCKHSQNINNIEKARIRKDYDMLILKLNSDIHIERLVNKRIRAMEKEAIEKDRIADEKIILAQNAVLQVKQKLKNFSESAARAGVDINEINLNLKEPIKEIMKIEEKVLNGG